MMRLRFWTWALLLGLCFPPALAGAAAAREQPMRFHAFWPCSGSASFCAVQILAQGRIAPDSARRLQAFLRSHRGKSSELPRHPVVAFDSAGGSVSGAMALGRFIRRQRLDTLVAAQYKQVDPRDWMEEVTLVRAARCADACVLAFAGGATRQMRDDARLGWVAGLPVDKTTGASTHAAYWREMGVAAEVARLPAGRWLDVDEAAALGLETARPQAQPWVLAPGRDYRPALTAQLRLAHGRQVQVTLRRQGDQVAVAVRLAFDAGLADAARVQLHPVDLPAQLAFITDDEWLRVRPAAPWQRTGMVFTASGTLSLAQACELAQAQSLRLADGMANAERDVSLAGPLSVQGLAEGMAALLRER